ncbi:hypothetical protein B7P43_G14124 [Cryptotermes secundus]|uniref:BHLH domain-containing protein n=1 Tax=Cryptotermes secundus TaxID=105785 RepID=A0A2J7RKR2_9NEOP|nr:hypothetical protein B7P43_G14124 [Cryptotermes secundus]
MSEENERDAGFCSGEDLEDPLEAEDDLHSPTDVSEDSVEVKVLPISLRNIKNKRKCAEPRKVASEDDDVLPPYKKRRHFINTESNKKASPILQVDRPPRPSSVTSLPGAINPRSSPASPFRPWSQQTVTQPSVRQEVRQCVSASVSTPSPPPPSYTPAHLPRAPIPRRCQSAYITVSRPPAKPNLAQPYNDRVPNLPHQQDEPLSLVLKNVSHADDDRIPQSREQTLHGSEVSQSEGPVHPSTASTHANRLRFDVPGRLEDVRFYGVAECEDRNTAEVEDLSSSLKQRTSNGKFSVESLLGGAKDSKGHDEQKPGPSSIASTSSNNNDQQKPKQSSLNAGQQRNYKNMTRERRIEANARERTRVHTISAAFDTLRRAIPAYSHNQKLSKLSVLRIACSYILTLSRVAGADYSVDSSEPSLAECVDLVSRTIQTEGKLRRKRDD